MQLPPDEIERIATTMILLKGKRDVISPLIEEACAKAGIDSPIDKLGALTDVLIRFNILDEKR